MVQYNNYIDIIILIADSQITEWSLSNPFSQLVHIVVNSSCQYG